MDIAFGMMEARYSCCWRLLRGNGRCLIWLVLGHGGRLRRNAFTRDALALATLIRFIVVSDVGIADDFNGITLAREFYPKAGPVPKGGQMKWVALFIIALIFAGLVYEQRGEWRHRKRYPQIGHSVDIGRRTLNVYCSGEGGPAVLFESGAHTSGYSWIAIQPEVAKFVRASWYDRAGYG